MLARKRDRLDLRSGKWPNRSRQGSILLRPRSTNRASCPWKKESRNSYALNREGNPSQFDQKPPMKSSSKIQDYPLLSHKAFPSKPTRRAQSGSGTKPVFRDPQSSLKQRDKKYRTVLRPQATKIGSNESPNRPNYRTPS